MVKENYIDLVYDVEYVDGGVKFTKRKERKCMMLTHQKQCTCLLCGKTWVSMVPHPKQCPGCKRKDWDGLHNSTGRKIDTAAKLAGVSECECKRCGNIWSPRLPNPKQCPACKSPRWSVPVGGVAVAAAESKWPAGLTKGTVIVTCEFCGRKWEGNPKRDGYDMCPTEGWVGPWPVGGYKRSAGPMPDREVAREITRRVMRGGDLSPDPDAFGPVNLPKRIRDPFDPTGL